MDNEDDDYIPYDEDDDYDDDPYDDDEEDNGHCSCYLCEQEKL